MCLLIKCAVSRLINTSECGSLKSNSFNWNYSCVSGKQLWTEIALTEQNTWQHLFLSHILPLCSNEKSEVRKIRWHQITTDVGQHQWTLVTNVTLKITQQECRVWMFLEFDLIQEIVYPTVPIEICTPL